MKIFISSVQKELVAERKALAGYLAGDPLLRRFFDYFLFEDQPAADQRADQCYLEEVDRSDIYLGIFGNEYGWEDAEGFSPTHREFNRATETGKSRLIYVKGADDGVRHPKMRALINEAGASLIRRGRNFPLPGDTPPHEVLAHLNLLDKGRPTHAAILLFGKQPQRFLITSEVKCAHFHGYEVAKPIPSYQVYKGTVFDLVDQAKDFVLSKIDLWVGTRAESTQAPTKYEIPQEVGDFGVLLYSGWGRAKALIVNLLVGLTAVLGGVVGFVLADRIDNFAAKTNKCSKFVADAYTKGASISDYPTKKVSILGRNNPIQANDLANKYSKITGPFAVTLNPKIGDIAAYGHYESVGHVAMVGIGKSFISASKDKVFLRTENFMGQHGFSNPTYRTYQPK